MRLGFAGRVLLGCVLFLSILVVIRRAPGQDPLDTDGDGLPDYYENLYGFDPSDPSDGPEDADFDGFSNFTEYWLGTNPTDPASHPTLADNSGKVFAYWPLMSDALEALGTGFNGDVRHGGFFEENALVLDGQDDYVDISGPIRA